MSAGVKSLMDYIMVKRRDKGEVINCKVILGETRVKQHRLDFKMRSRKPGERTRRSKLKYGTLKERSVTSIEGMCKRNDQI